MNWKLVSEPPEVVGYLDVMLWVTLPKPRWNGDTAMGMSGHWDGHRKRFMIDGMHRDGEQPTHWSLITPPSDRVELVVEHHISGGTMMMIADKLVEKLDGSEAKAERLQAQRERTNRNAEAAKLIRQQAAENAVLAEALEKIANGGTGESMSARELSDVLWDVRETARAALTLHRKAGE